MPTMTGTEYSSVVLPPTPGCSVVVGDEIITFGTYDTTTPHTLPNNDVWTRYDITTGVRSVYTGCYPTDVGGTFIGRVQSAVAFSSTLIYYTADSYSSFTWGTTRLFRLDLSTNTASWLSNSSFIGPLRFDGTDTIIGAGSKWVHSTSTRTALSNSGYGLGYAAGRLLVAADASTTLNEVSVSSGSITATYTFPVAAKIINLTGIAQKFPAAVIGTKIYWAANNTNVAFVGFDTATNTTFHQMYAVGLTGSRLWRAGPDGLLYEILNDSVTVVDPANGEWATLVNYPTTRTRRYGSGAVWGPNGKLWVPSGDPAT